MLAFLQVRVPVVALAVANDFDAIWSVFFSKRKYAVYALIIDNPDMTLRNEFYTLHHLVHSFDICFAFILIKGNGK